MKSTGIQWTDDTSNPTTGCDGCELWIPGKGGPCYAGNFHESRLAKAIPTLYDADFRNVRLAPGRLLKTVRCMDLTGLSRPQKPWLNGLPRLIFVGDLGDIFSAAVPFDYLRTEIIDNATSNFGRRHILQLLTKQPARVVQFQNWLAASGTGWPENIWVGTSITGAASKARIKHLKQITTSIRFLSVEPLVGDPNFTDDELNDLQWVIVGGESNQAEHPAREFRLEWLRDIINRCHRLSVPVFVKQLGSNVTDALPGPTRTVVRLADHHGGDWDEWPGEFRIRDMPNIGTGK